MPSRKMNDGTHKDVAHPITNDLRQKIEEKIVAAYTEKTGEKITLKREKKEEK